MVQERIRLMQTDVFDFMALRTIDKCDALRYPVSFPVIQKQSSPLVTDDPKDLSILVVADSGKIQFVTDYLAVAKSVLFGQQDVTVNRGYIRRYW